MLFADLFANQVPREVAGSRSANRFDYQISWSICHLLELHASEGDYAIVMDYHEDVVVFNCSKNPTEAKFYQIKTSDSDWTVKKLVAAKRGKVGPLPSPLAKLYSNYVLWKSQARCLGFVSNTPLSAKDSTKKSTKQLSKVAFSRLCSDDAAVLTEGIRKEFSDESDFDGLQLFVFERSALSKDGHADGALGKMAKFLDGLTGADHVRPAAFFRAVKDEVAGRCHYERIPVDFADLRKHKAITREDFAGILAHACAVRTPKNLLRSVCETLRAEGEHFFIVHQIEQQAAALELNLMDGSSTLLMDDMRSIRDELARHEVASLPLRKTIEEVLRSEVGKKLLATRREGFVRAMIGVCIYESAEELSDANSRSQKEEES